jgi:hypothetical protein
MHLVVLLMMIPFKLPAGLYNSSIWGVIENLESVIRNKKGGFSVKWGRSAESAEDLSHPIFQGNFLLFHIFISIVIHIQKTRTNNHSTVLLFESSL